ncbi:hypothetical protein ABDK96_15490 [Citricoccus nitrophenolicus]|uniref:Integrase n=1 Tax=Citricoccus nitrophenolicus TaxID=863575 RepID=A0ABV0INI0_9MICC|nr:hypothetical protein [Citricoccus sp. I39-566]WMY79744.1 hypothetical protein RE421_07840 [Citricoccus sp. I39-566]
MSGKAYSVTSDSTGLGFGFRLRWRLAYMATYVTGSASRQGTLDPSAQLRRDRAQRLLKGYQAEGTEPPAELTRIAQGY